MISDCQLMLEIFTNMFHAIQELMQSRNCIAHSRKPQVAFQSRDCTYTCSISSAHCGCTFLGQVCSVLGFTQKLKFEPQALGLRLILSSWIIFQPFFLHHVATVASHFLHITLYKTSFLCIDRVLTFPDYNMQHQVKIYSTYLEFNQSAI